MLTGEPVADKSRTVGSGKEIKGSVKTVKGKLVGDARMQADGKAGQTEGKVRNMVGSIKDALKP